MYCPPVRGDNPRALAFAYRWAIMALFYITNINVDMAYHEIVRAKFSKGGIKGLAG